MAVSYSKATVTPAQAKDIRSNLRANCLMPFWAGLANRSYSPCDILLLGDSITEGRGVTNFQDSRRWASKFRDQLRARYQPTGITGGEGYVPSHYASPNLSTRWTLTGGNNLADQYGFGRRSNHMTTGMSMSLTFTGTRVDIFWAGGPTSGHFTWQIDGGATTNVDTFTATLTDGQRTQISGLSAASHTLNIAWASGGTVVIDGAAVMNGDETSGIRVWEAGHSGYKVGDYVDATYPRWIDNVGTLQPKLVIIELLANDEGAGTSTATCLTNLQTLITNIRAKCTLPPSIVLTAIYPRGDQAASAWTPYYNVIKQVVAADPTLLLHDLQARFGTDMATNTYGLMASDLVHPSDKGHQMYADSLVDLVSP